MSFDKLKNIINDVKDEISLASCIHTLIEKLYMEDPKKLESGDYIISDTDLIKSLLYGVGKFNFDGNLDDRYIRNDDFSEAFVLKTSSNEIEFILKLRNRVPFSMSNRWFECDLTIDPNKKSLVIKSRTEESIKSEIKDFLFNCDNPLLSNFYKTKSKS